MKPVSANLGRGQRAGFTLIELLTVITIILILAGLVLAVAGHANFKAAQSRAQSEIAGLSTSAGNYQIDTGTYPRVQYPSTANPAIGDAVNNTDKLDARDASGTYLDPAANTTPTYAATSLILYQLLSGISYIGSDGKTKFWVSGNADGVVTRPTTYYTFKDSQLKYSATGAAQDPTKVTYIADPFGFSYGYSTAFQADMDQINGGSTAFPNGPTHGFNPTFDLWCTCGFSQTQGKAAPTGITTAAGMVNLWTKNW